jgi:hypothetical protein
VALKLRSIHRRRPLQTLLREALDIGLAATDDGPEGRGELAIHSSSGSRVGT